MSLITRILNALAPSRLHRDLDEELQSHLNEAIAHGRNPEEARRALGSPLRHRESSRDVKLLYWLDSLRADALFGLRQLRKNKITSAAAILSLALALGATTTAFRLIDALLLRPLPVAHADHLYLVTRKGLNFDGVPGVFDGTEYPLYQIMRNTAKDQADLVAVSWAKRQDVTFTNSDQDTEKAQVQYVSGNLFQVFNLKPALGRLLTEADDLHPGSHPQAVISYDYWTSRFARDPNVVGRTFQFGSTIYEIVGVTTPLFTGTEPGILTNIFIPSMMNECATRSDCSWIRVLAQLHEGVPIEPLRAQLHANYRAFQGERAKSFTGIPPEKIANFLNQKIGLDPAPAGVSDLQETNRESLAALAALVTLVLLIACANLANLMTAQSAARAREMALRVSIGAGRARLVQLVLMESAWVAFFAAALGAVLAWWAAPFVVAHINPPDNPARLALPADWRVLAFATTITAVVTLLFSLTPALRASSVQPVSALKGGEDPHYRRHMMHVLIAAQVAFCFVVLFVTGLFVTTFDHLTHQSIGFTADRLLTLDTVTKSPQSVASWDQVTDHLRNIPGVEKVAIASWPLLDGNGWNGFVSVNGAPPSPILAYFLGVTPQWADTMKIPFVAGRDFLPTDTPNVAIVNEAFAKAYFKNQNPIGKSFEKTSGTTRFEVIGVIGDARYRNMREPITPTGYLPLYTRDPLAAANTPTQAAFLIRTTNPNPQSLSATLRQEITSARPEFRVSRIRTQQEINDAHTIRERLLVTLGVFFATVALVLAAVGLYGVLHYTVLQRRRELGIRIAIGATSPKIARVVSKDIASAIFTGAIAGIVLSFTTARSLESILYQVKPTDISALSLSAVMLVTTAALATTPAILRAIHIDPATLLRSD
jgi:putative ABC transport system permease protein